MIAVRLPPATPRFGTAWQVGVAAAACAEAAVIVWLACRLARTCAERKSELARDVDVLERIAATLLAIEGKTERAP